MPRMIDDPNAEIRIRVNSRYAAVAFVKAIKDSGYGPVQITTGITNERATEILRLLWSMKVFRVIHEVGVDVSEPTIPVQRISNPIPNGCRCNTVRDEKRCSITELLIGQCACIKCKPELAVEVERGHPHIGSLFIAAFDSFEGCDCGNVISEGDEICYIDGVVSCVDCFHKEQGKETAKFTKGWKDKIKKED